MQTMRNNLIYIEERYRKLQGENAQLVQREQELLRNLELAKRVHEQ